MRDHAIWYIFEDKEGNIEPGTYHFMIDGIRFCDWLTAGKYLSDTYGLTDGEANSYLTKLPTDREEYISEEWSE